MHYTNIYFNKEEGFPINTYTQELWSRIRHLFQQCILGHESMLDLLLIAYLARGHVLVEGPPGTGKTMTAKLLAKLLARSFKRVQFTSDMLPSDILGAHIYSPDEQGFRFIRGPIFTDFLLADEINRTPPRTQSALLEAMEEKQITMDGEEFTLSPDFFVIATQNPQDHEGTFLLPEVQLDRFLFKIVLDHADAATEIKVLKNILEGIFSALWNEAQTLSFDRIQVDRDIAAVKTDPSILEYISKLLAKTRGHPMLSSGSSLRGGIALGRCARILALSRNRDFVIIDDIKALAIPVLRHRIKLSPEAQVSQVMDEHVIQNFMAEIPFPE